MIYSFLMRMCAVLILPNGLAGLSWFQGGRLVSPFQLEANIKATTTSGTCFPTLCRWSELFALRRLFLKTFGEFFANHLQSISVMSCCNFNILKLSEWDMNHGRNT